MSSRAPASRYPVLHFDALRLVALREGDMIEETLATENERDAYTRTCARTPSPRSSLLLEQACSPLPAHSAHWLGGPCLASCSMYLRALRGFIWPVSKHKNTSKTKAKGGTPSDSKAL